MRVNPQDYDPVRIFFDQRRVCRRHAPQSVACQDALAQPPMNTSLLLLFFRKEDLL
jgi:hypothetical protein